MHLSFLHGFMGHPSDWDQIRSGLADHESMATPVPDASDWESSVRTLGEAVPERSILVGYSMGARLALGVAIESPSRCGGLVFISGNPGLEQPAERDQRRRVDDGIAERIENESPDQFLADWYNQPVFSTVSESVRYAERKRKLQMLSDGRADRQRWSQTLRVNSISKQPDYWTRLDELSVPVLLVAGENDQKYRKMIDRFAQRISAIKPTVRILPGCGHIVHREDPDALIAVLREFLNTHSHP